MFGIPLPILIILVRILIKLGLVNLAGRVALRIGLFIVEEGGKLKVYKEYPNDPLPEPTNQHNFTTGQKLEP